MQNSYKRFCTRYFLLIGIVTNKFLSLPTCFLLHFHYIDWAIHIPALHIYVGMIVNIVVFIYFTYWYFTVPSWFYKASTLSDKVFLRS